MPRTSSRRQFLAASSLALAAALLPVGALLPAPGTTRRTRLILLGTKGGPTPATQRGAPSQVIVIDDVPYVVDCGDGVASRLVAAGVSLDALRTIFVTHHHSDHNADYGNLILLAWTGRRRVDTYGPPPLVEMTRLFFEMNRYDIETRIADEGKPNLVEDVYPHEITTGGLVMEDERVRVTAALVDHPPVVPAFAYRFDGPDRSIVISGDTTYSENLIALAEGADVLVHETMYLPGIEALVRRFPEVPRLREHLLASHTTTEDVGRVAARAGVGTVVLSHFVPGADPSITDAMWAEGVRAHFDGEIVVGRDLLEI